MSPAPTVRQLASHVRAHARLADTDTLAAARCRAPAPMWSPLLPRCFPATTGHAPLSNSGPSASSLIVPSDINVFICDITMVNNSLLRPHAYYFLRRRSTALSPVRQPQITRSKVKLPFADAALRRAARVSLAATHAPGLIRVPFFDRRPQPH